MRYQAIVFGILAAGLTAGCSDGPPPPSPDQRQADILAHPMEYKPDIGQSSSSNGDMTSFDRAGFGKDWNSLWNP